MTPITEALKKVVEREDLTRDESHQVMGQIMEGEATSAQIGAFLTALRMKGETVEEITGFALAMREKVRPVQSQWDCLVDTCGTGGDGCGTFNISTAAAFVAAGAGVRIAKHGNRSVSSRSGSADVLLALGIRIDLEPEEMSRSIDEVGMGFLFAPALHPAMKHALGPRRELGLRTVFNLLGPLTNPAGATRQILGVYALDRVEPIGRVLANLGAEKAYVVHGHCGLDEISTLQPTSVAEVGAFGVKLWDLDAAEWGIPRTTSEALACTSPEESAEIIERTLRGGEGPARDVVAVNAAAAIAAAGLTDTIEEALPHADETIRSGAAYDRLQALRAMWPLDK